MTYAVSAFLPAVNAVQYDKDGDGKISKDNGELQELLAGNNARNEYELLIENPKKGDYRTAVGFALTSAIVPAVGLTAMKLSPLPFTRLRELLVECKNHPTLSYPEAKQKLKDLLLQGVKDDKVVLALAAVASLAFAAYFALSKPE